jgi:hypothetical protein
MLNALTALSLLFLVVAVLACVRRPIPLPTLAFAHIGRYCEISISDGAYQAVIIDHYPRTEPAHLQHGSAAGVQLPGRGIWIEGSRDEISWIETVRCVLGERYRSDVRPWPQGWPPEMLTGHYIAVHLIHLPVYVPLVLSGFFPLFSALGRSRRWLSARKAARNQGRCKSCGYDLRATPDRCPECGTVVGAKPS